jgi:hypothetical protein
MSARVRRPNCAAPKGMRSFFPAAQRFFPPAAALAAKRAAAAAKMVRRAARAEPAAGAFALADRGSPAGAGGFAGPRAQAPAPGRGARGGGGGGIGAGDGQQRPARGGRGHGRRSCDGGRSGGQAARRRAGNRGRRGGPSRRYPINTVYLPLSYNGNPGVEDESYRGCRRRRRAARLPADPAPSR